MLKVVLTGELIAVDVNTITMQEGQAVAKYSREHYRLASELDQPFQLIYGLHAIAIPWK